MLKSYDSVGQELNITNVKYSMMMGREEEK